MSCRYERCMIVHSHTHMHIIHVHTVSYAHTHIKFMTYSARDHPQNNYNFNLNSPNMHTHCGYNVMQLRSRRQAGSGTPTPHGDYLFAGDGNQYARIYYSGSPSPVSLIATSFRFYGLNWFLPLGHMYRCMCSTGIFVHGSL